MFRFKTIRFYTRTNKFLKKSNRRGKKDPFLNLKKSCIINGLTQTKQGISCKTHRATNTCRIPWYVSIIGSNTQQSSRQQRQGNSQAETATNTATRSWFQRTYILCIRLIVIVKTRGATNTYTLIIVRNTAVTTQTQQGTSFLVLEKSPRCGKYMYTTTASVFNQVKIQLSRAGLVQQQYEVHTKGPVRVSIARSITNTARQQATAKGQQSGKNSNEHSCKAGGGHRAIVKTVGASKLQAD